MRIRGCLLAVFALPGLNAVAIGELLTVGPDPLLYNFANIQLAVDAAAPGDTLLVAPGVYEPFDIDKPLQVLGSGSSSCAIKIQPIFSEALGIDVTGVDQGSVRVGGFSILPEAGAPDHIPWVRVWTNEAPVELFDLRMALTEPQFSANGYFSLSLSRQVVLSGCHVTGPADLPAQLIRPPAPGAIDGSHGLWVYRSEVWVNDCTFEGNGATACGEGVFGGAPRAGTGAEITESTVVLANTVLRGGQGAASLPGCPPIDAAPGLRGKFGSFTEVHSGPRSSIVGGYAAGDAAPGPGALIGGTATFLYGTGELPIGGDSESGVQGLSIAPIGPNLTLQPTEGPRPTLSAAPQVLSVGATGALDHAGLPGALHWTVISAETAYGALAAPVVGQLFVDPSQAVVLAPLILDSNGLGRSALNIPRDPSLIGFSGIAQIAQAGSGPLVLSAPLLLSIVP